MRSGLRLSKLLPMNKEPFFSVIIPVKNEGAVLSRCLDSLMKLDYPRERFEIIIADGLSTDNTRDIAGSYTVKIVDNDKQIVASGRNRAFQEAIGDIIVFTDADCVFQEQWLRNSVKYFADEKIGGVGGLTLSPENSSPFEKAVDLLFCLAELLRVTSHRKDLSSIREVSDIPGCNAMYRKEALGMVMPVNENLLTAEDVWMNFCVRKSGYKLLHAPDVILWHYRRNSLKKFLRQIYRFAVGRLQVGRKNAALLNIFHIAAGISLPLFLLLLIIFWLSGSLALFLKTSLIVTVLIIFLSFLKTRSLAVSFNLFLIIVLFIAGWSIGFLKELILPLKDTRGK